MDKIRKDLLVFGYGLGLITAVFGVGGLLKHGLSWAPVTLLVCAVVFAGVTLWDADALKPGYRGWMKVAHFIGGIITTVILAGVFFLLFAPIGILFRLIGKDHLERRWDKTAATYWHARLAEDIPKERYQQQF
jgi:uncharacterized membrane protein